MFSASNNWKDVRPCDGKVLKRTLDVSACPSCSRPQVSMTRKAQVCRASPATAATSSRSTNCPSLDPLIAPWNLLTNNFSISVNAAAPTAIVDANPPTRSTVNKERPSLSMLIWHKPEWHLHTSAMAFRQLAGKDSSHRGHLEILHNG